MSIIDFCKKHLFLGVISQLIITGIAGAVALIEGFILFIIGFIIIAPGGKYGPPPDPTMPIVKYGAPVTPIPDGGQIDLGSLFTTGNIVAGLIVLASLALYAWTILGWAFWGSILYLKMRENKK
jgi:hypothetical protein